MEKQQDAIIECINTQEQERDKVRAAAKVFSLIQAPGAVGDTNLSILLNAY